MLERLSGTRAFTTALIARPAHVPARRVLTGPLQASRAMDVIEDSELVVHLAGSLRPVDSSYWDDNVASAGAVASAVKRGATRRVVFLSYVGADAASANEYLRTKAEAERILEGTGREIVVFRATHIIGTPDAPGPIAEAFLARGERAVLVPGDGTQRVAPIFLDDVVSALVAALAGGAPGRYELAGPETMTLDDLVALLNGGLAHVRHVPARVARLAARFIPSLPRAVVDLMLRDSVGDPSRAVEAFGVDLHSLREMWSWQWI